MLILLITLNMIMMFKGDELDDIGNLLNSPAQDCFQTLFYLDRWARKTSQGPPAEGRPRPCDDDEPLMMMVMMIMRSRRMKGMPSLIEHGGKTGCGGHTFPPDWRISTACKHNTPNILKYLQICTKIYLSSIYHIISYFFG